jgi:alpha-glucuronidase
LNALSGIAIISTSLGSVAEELWPFGGVMLLCCFSYSCISELQFAHLLG